MTDDKELEELMMRLYIKVETLTAEGVDTNELAHIVAEIRRELEERGSKVENHDSLVDSLRAQIEKIESEHPSATRILNNILMKLSSMGI